MDSLRLRLLILLVIIGCAMCTEPGTPKEEQPFCKSYKLNPCFEAAIRSYTINTRGLEVGKGPLIKEDIDIVSFEMSEDISAPWADINKTCEILMKMDWVELHNCIATLSEGCRTDYPIDEDLIEDHLPSMRGQQLADSLLWYPRVCTSECRANAYSLPDRFVTLKTCWRSSVPALEAAKNDQLSSSDCRILDDYMQCQWNNSIGCPYLETVTRVHLLSMLNAIGKCNIQLPREALKEPEKEQPEDEQKQTDSVIASSTTAKPLLTIHVLLFITGTAIHSFFSTTSTPW